MTKKTLPRKNPNNPQIKSYAMAVKKGLESYHVIPLGSCHWAVKKAGSNNRLTKVLPTQKQAISHGKKIAKSNKTELFIHKADGRIKSRESYL